MEPLWTCLQAKIEEDIIARQEKLDDDRARIGNDRDQRKAHMKESL
jgi:hypothetical protein